MPDEARTRVSLATTFKVPATVVRESLSEDELVVLHTTTHRFYSVNSTGRRVYELAASGSNARMIAEAVAAEFAIEFEECATDILEILEDFVDKDLLVLG